MKGDGKTYTLKNTMGEVQPYKDVVFRTVTSIITGIYMTLYREEESFFMALFNVNFWIGVAFSFSVSLLLLWIINRVSFWLDQVYGWPSETLLRILAQAGCGVVLPAVLAFLLVSLFLSLFGINILETNYLDADFPLVVVLIVLGNIYYLTYYLWRENRLFRQQFAVVHTEAPQVEEQKPRMFMAKTENGIVPIAQDDIAAVFRQEEYVLIRSFDRQAFIIQQAIKQVMQDLNPDAFFRINPRFIINKRICQTFRHAEYGKLEVDLGPPVNLKEVVSRGSAQAFEDWMKA